MAGGLHREPRDRRSTCIRRYFSWLRCRTSFQNGVTEAHQNLLTSPKTKFARSASEPRLQGLLAQDEPETQHLEQRSLVFYYSWSHRSHWGLWISKQLWCRIWPPNGSNLNRTKKTSGNGKEFAEVLGADEETQSHLHWQFPGIWPILWRLILESLYVNTTQIRNKWDCRKSRAQSERSAVLLQSGLGNECRAGSMECCTYLRNIQDLLSDGKTTLWKAIRRTTQRTKNSIWSNGRISHHLCQKTNLDCISLEQKSCQVYLSVMHYTRAESGKETLWSQTLKNWRRWTRLNSTPEGSMQRKYVNADERWQFLPVTYLMSTDTPKIQYQTEVEVRVKSFGETRCMNPQNRKQD